MIYNLSLSATNHDHVPERLEPGDTVTVQVPTPSLPIAKINVGQYAGKILAHVPFTLFVEIKGEGCSRDDLLQQLRESRPKLWALANEIEVEISEEFLVSETLEL